MSHACVEHAVSVGGTNASCSWPTSGMAAVSTSSRLRMMREYRRTAGITTGPDLDDSCSTHFSRYTRRGSAASVVGCVSEACTSLCQEHGRGDLSNRIRSGSRWQAVYSPLRDLAHRWSFRNGPNLGSSFDTTLGLLRQQRGLELDGAIA
jgi:hypothetical protein